MTFEQLKIVYTNALCCSSELAVKVSDLYSRGDKCADFEMIKLKLLNDKILILKDWLNDHCNLVKNGEFTYDLSYWDNVDVGDAGPWLWNSGEAYFEASDQGAGIAQNCLVPGRKYLLSFDYHYTPGVNPLGEYIRIKVGTSEYFVNPITASTTLQHVELEITCVGNSTFSLYTSFDSNTNSILYLDNVIIRNTDDNGCLTEEQIDTLTHDIMKSCEICDCQLT